VFDTLKTEVLVTLNTVGGTRLHEA
jgi:hypothetical protein